MLHQSAHQLHTSRSARTASASHHPRSAHLQGRHVRASERRILVRAAEDDEAPSTSYQNSLEVTIKRKSKQVEAQLLELGMEALEERLSSATQNPAQVGQQQQHQVYKLLWF